jgi:hypothetical protein
MKRVGERRHPYDCITIFPLRFQPLCFIYVCFDCAMYGYDTRFTTYGNDEGCVIGMTSFCLFT